MNREQLPRRWAAAVQAAAEGDRPRAQKLMAEVVRAGPNDPAGWEQLARYLDDPDQIEDCLQQARKLRRQRAAASGRGAPTRVVTVNSSGPHGAGQGRESSDGSDQERAWKVAESVESALARFGLTASASSVTFGPRHVVVGIQPDRASEGQRQRLNTVAEFLRRKDDIALALSAGRVTVGQDYSSGLILLTLPRPDRQDLRLLDVLADTRTQTLLARQRLPLLLGRRWDGEPIVDDLAALPHLLIGGATGSGKSVSLNAILSAMLLLQTPDDLRLMLIDLKRVELMQYAGIAHLLAPPITEPGAAIRGIEWLVRELEARYRLFEQTGARDLDVYNQRAAGRFGQRLPRILTIIDEFTDLNQMGGSEFEDKVVRVARMGRAAGLHLIMATQKPSAKTMSPQIRANLPARLALRVANHHDSASILDESGAEDLLGQGDLLYRSPTHESSVRGQACRILDEELDRLTGFWRMGDRSMPDILKREPAGPRFIRGDRPGSWRRADGPREAGHRATTVGEEAAWFSPAAADVIDVRL